MEAAVMVLGRNPVRDRSRLFTEVGVLFFPGTDELTTGLDPQARRQIWEYLKELQQEGITIVLSSHYMDEVEYLCDSIAILRDGEIVASGAPAELIRLHQDHASNLEDVFLLYTGKRADGQELCA